MSLILSGTDGLSDIDGSAATPAIRGTDANTGIFFPAADTIAFAEGGVESMRIDLAGNMGLGLVPSAWNSAYKAFQFGTTGSLYGEVGEAAVYLGCNVYVDSVGNKYTTTDFATQYSQENGVHKWLNAASGTAGNAISFTQAMTLNASGNLGLGTTSPSGISSFTTMDIRGSGGGGLRFGTTSAASAYLYCDTDVVLGTGSATANLAFQANGSERVRIDTSGNFLVGTATVISPNPGISLTPGSGSQIAIGHGNGQASGTYYAYFVYNGTVIGSITQSGTTAVLYNTTSDQRLKENIQDADSASSLIDSLQVRKFDWKADGSHQRYGFVAQELVAVYPEAVHQPIDTEDMMAVDYSKLVPLLVKEIQSLKARLDAANL